MSNGQWADANEQIFTSTPLTAGVNNLSFVVPPTAIPGDTFARFRFSTTGGLLEDGLAVDGEVEDYRVAIAPAVNLVVTQSGEPNPVTVLSNLVYAITVTNFGPSIATGVRVTNALPVGMSLVSASVTQGGCTNVAGTITCAIGTLAEGAGVAMELVVTANRAGTMTNTVRAGANEFEVTPANNAATQVTSVILPLFAPAVTDIIDVADSDEFGVGLALPYPSTIFVTGLTTTVYKGTDALGPPASPSPCKPWW